MDKVVSSRWLRLARAVAVLAAGALMVPTSPLNVAQAAPDNTFVPTVDRVFRDHTAPVDARIDDIMESLTLDEMVTLGVSGGTVPRLGLNGGRAGGGEGLHGVSGAGYTVFPTPLGMSQSWDPDLMYKVGDAIAAESSANGGGISRLAPVLDLNRDPRYGRAYETLGEDSLLTGTLGSQITQGMNKRTADGYQAFIPILKHPLAYNTEVNRLWVNSVMPPQVENDYFIKGFEQAISEGGAKSLMNSYPLVNGKPMSVNPLQKALLWEWTPNYEGSGHYEYTTTNDYGSGSSMWVHSQRYFDDTPLGRALGAGEGVKNGQMGWSLRSFGSVNGLIYEALARGILTPEDLYDNARRRITMALRTGDLDHVEIQNPHFEALSKPLAPLVTANRETGLRAAQEQIVLLKNDSNTLPLKGSATNAAVLLGDQGETIYKDHYTGTGNYSVSIHDALRNKLGESNVSFNRAVDTVAIKAPNGSYLLSANNAYVNPGAATGTPIRATGTPANGTAVSLNTPADRNLLFERYDYGEFSQVLRTPINDRAVQVPNAPGANRWLLINSTTMPGQRNATTGSTYSVFQDLRITPTNDGKFGIYSVLAGNGANNSYGASSMAYDVDDEDLNNGAYMYLNAADAIQADVTEGHVGPFRAETHTNGASILTAPFDSNPNDSVIDGLPADYKFEFETVNSSTQAIAQAVAAAPSDAPIMLVVGNDSWLTSREAVDLQRTGLSDQQKRNINYITNTLGRDVILIVKIINSMEIDESIQNNPKVKAIVEIGQSGQEEGSALVSALFDDGYTVPTTGFYPRDNRGYNGPTSYATYPGYLPEANKVPAYAPAGRLTNTWYKQITDMIGASEDHAPASYRWPAYDEATNDNLSNMNGAIPTGLMTYDIIKGQRTYRYFKGEPLYPFGYGLTYTNFAYSNVAVSAIADGKFTVSGRVTNNGTIKSDEVVQIYSSFTGTPSRIVQSVNKLIAFDRLRDIAPGEGRNFSFDVDLVDQLGVWDVETKDYVVEPGAYRIKAAKSATDTGTAVTLNVTTANGGKAAPARNLSKLVVAENFDDYSNISGDTSDIELVSSSVEYLSNTAVQFRKDNAWISYKNVTIPAGTTRMTAKVGSDRASNLDIYALPVGTDPAALSVATPVGTPIGLTDSRPVSGIPVGLGIGPISVKSTLFGGMPYPGSPNGQNDLDAKGQPYKNAYIKPEYTVRTKALNLSAGSYDIYVKVSKRGPRLEWFKFGTAADTTQDLAISQLESATSIRLKNGTLQLRADLTPQTSTSPVYWDITDEDGFDTSLATIDSKGLVRATGYGNGVVKVTAISNSHSDTWDVLVTNQLDSDRVNITLAAPNAALSGLKTVEYLMVRGATAFGGDNIQRYQGTVTQSAVFAEQFSENINKYYLPSAAVNYMTVPSTSLTWTIAGEDGLATNLATIQDNGTVTATGLGDGKVVATATLNTNPDITASRVITIQNQGIKNSLVEIQAVNYDATTGTAPGSGSAWAGNATSLGNQVGFYAGFNANSTITYKNVDFKSLTKRVAARISAPTAGTIEVWADAGSVAAGGTRLGTIAVTATGANAAAANANYATFVENLAVDPTAGIHDVVLRPSAAMRVIWFQFAGAEVDNRLLLQAILNQYADDRAHESLFTPATFGPFKTAYDNGRTVADDPASTPQQINAAIDALKNTGAALVRRLADVSALEEAIDLATAILADATGWVSTSVAGLQAKVDAGLAVLADATSTQAQVDAATAAIYAEMAKRIPRGDISALLVMIAYAEDLTQATYTPASWTALQTALTAAKAVVALAEPSVEQVETAINNLAAAIGNLKAVPQKAALKSVIDIAQIIADNSGLYVPASLAGLSDALASAKAVYADADATQAQVDAARSALTAKVSAARLRAVTGSLELSVRAASLVSTSSYTPTTVAAFRAAVADAQAVLADLGSTQAQVDKAESRIAKTRAALKVDANPVAQRSQALAKTVVPAKAAKAAKSAKAVKAVKLAKPKIKGSKAVGKKLRAKVSGRAAKAGLSYQWLRDGKAIKGAVKATYKVKKADLGKRLSVKVTVAKAGLVKVSKATKTIVK